MPVILLHLLPASLYALLGLHFWRSRWLQPALGPRQELLPWERGALLAALGAHGFALHHAFFASNGMVFGFSLALSLMLWLAVLFYWIESLYARLDGLLVGVSIAALFQFRPHLRVRLTRFGNGWVVLSAGLLVAAYFVCEEPQSLGASVAKAVGQFTAGLPGAEVKLSPELVDYRLYGLDEVLCWPAGTGYALADWLTSRGHTPRFVEWSKR